MSKGAKITLDRFPEHHGHMIEIWSKWFIPSSNARFYTSFRGKVVQKRCNELDIDTIITLGALGTKVTLDMVTK